MHANEVPAASLVDQRIPVEPGGPQGGVAVRGGEKHCDTTLGRVDTVDMDLMIDRDQALPVAAVKGRAQIAEQLAITGVGGTGMAERGDPPVTVARRVGPVLPSAQIQDAGAAGRSVEHLLFLIAHGHLWLPSLSRTDTENVTRNTNVTYRLTM